MILENNPNGSNLDVSTLAKESKQDTEISSLASIDTKLTNNATSTLQASGNSSLSSIDTKLSSQATAANQNLTGFLFLAMKMMNQKSTCRCMKYLLFVWLR